MKTTEMKFDKLTGAPEFTPEFEEWFKTSRFYAEFEQNYQKTGMGAMVLGFKAMIFEGFLAGQQFSK